MSTPRRTLIIEKLAREAQRVRPHRKLLMLGLVLAAGLFLLTLKQGGEQERAAAVSAKLLSLKQRDATNADITRAMQTRFGGVSTNHAQLKLVARVGVAVAAKTDARYAHVPLRFHLLAEPNSINSYALASGDIYLTTALLNRMQTEGQLAAVLAHAAAHVIAGDALFPVEAEALALPAWQHTTTQEAAADALAVTLMGQAGYDPNALNDMLGVLVAAYQAGADVAFFTTHPNTTDRLTRIAATIAARYPEGVPTQFSK
ncbi:MAG: M48 family metalloprotease [Alphaproteobacteria bacterium]|nr:M48 family metalloprotease [Alphaproteobacteria bacterium]